MYGIHYLLHITFYVSYKINYIFYVLHHALCHHCVTCNNIMLYIICIILYTVNFLSHNINVTE